MWTLILVRLERDVILEQGRCSVCAMHTIGLKIILDNLIQHLGDMGHVESHFSPFRDCVSIGVR
jgi:Fe-S cluster biogenesis protein NfuA